MNFIKCMAVFQQNLSCLFYLIGKILACFNWGICYNVGAVTLAIL